MDTSPEEKAQEMKQKYAKPDIKVTDIKSKL